MKQPVILHCHSQHSFLDGMSSTKEMVGQAKALNMEALAITNHGNIFAFVEFQKECQKQGIKSILGMEIYLTPNHSEKERHAYHLVLLAENQTGLSNLIKLTTLANRNFYFKPRVDFNDLKNHSNGLIALTACMHGPVAYQLYDKMTWPKDGEESQLKEAANIPKAYEYANQLLSIFGSNNLFLEVQDAGIPEQKLINNRIRSLASQLGVKTVATQDFHYVRKEDAKAHSFLKAMAYGKAAVEEGNHHGFSTDEFYIKSRDEWLKNSDLSPEEVDLTVKIAERCNSRIELGKSHMPTYPYVPEGKAALDFLKEKLRNGWKRLNIKDINNQYLNRLNRELSDVESANLIDYFLIMSDITDFCRSKSIMTGPSRGSAGGSLVSYLLGITNIDPIKYNLVWERFYNAGRKGSLPDIDSDIEKSRREEVLEYIKDRFGRDKVAQLVTLSSLGAKQAIRDTLKVAGIDETTKDYVASLIPMKNDDHASISLQEAIDAVPELKKMSEDEEPIEIQRNGRVLRKTSWKELFNIAKRIEGCYKTSGVHAAALVISDKSFDEAGIPLVKGPTKEELVCGWDMDAIDALGFLKVDILGLATLSVINTTLQLIKKRHGIDIDIENIPLDDPKVGQLITSGKNEGVFQLESQLGKSWSIKCEPGLLNPDKTVEESGDLVSIIRPAVLDAGLADSYVKRKNGEEPVTYLHPLLEPILKSTYGIMLYQEQMMEIANKICEWDLKRCDMLRKSIAKKNPSELKAFRDDFILSATKTVGADTAEEIWGWMEGAAGYGFNRCISGETYIMMSSSFDENIQVKDLWEYYHGNKSKEFHRCQKTRKNFGHFCLMMKHGRIKVGKIHDVFKTGVRTTYELVTDNDDVIRATKHHKFMMKDGWKELKDINVGDTILTAGSILDRLNHNYIAAGGPLNGFPIIEAKVVSISDPQKEETYDIEMTSKEHNYIANNIITHNSHAMGYSLLAYRTAWLKANYYIEFLCANLMHASDKANQQRTPQDVIGSFINDAKLYGVDIKPPILSAKNIDFEILDDKTIAFGLSHIKGVGDSAITKLVKVNDIKTFSEFLTKAKQLKINKGVIDALISCGALSELSSSRKLMRTELSIVDFLTDNEQKSLEFAPAISLYDKIAFIADDNNINEMKKLGIKPPNVSRRAKIRQFMQSIKLDKAIDSVPQILNWEKQYLGTALSGSVADLKKYMVRGGVQQCISLVDGSCSEKTQVNLCVVIEDMREVTIKNGKSKGRQMAFLKVSDSSYTLDGVCAFPDILDKMKEANIQCDDIVNIKGVVGKRGLEIRKIESL